MNKISELQTQYSSMFDKRKICSYDVEQILELTHLIMHQNSRFLYFTKGKGTIKLNGKSYEILPNSCVAIIPWEISEVTEVLEPLQFIKVIYNFNFLNENIKASYSPLSEEMNFLQELSECPIVYCDKKEAENLSIILNDIKEEVGVESLLDTKQHKILSNIYITNKIIEFLIHYIRIKHKTKNLDCIDSSNISQEDKSSIFKYLYSHLREKQTLKSISSLFYISESTLSNYCVSITGNTFHDLLDEMRLVKTMDFLMYSDFSLNMIAEIVGFGDASHLSKFFTKRIGTTPRKYRKINQNVVNILNSEEKNITYDLIMYIKNNFLENLDEKYLSEKFSMSISEINKILLFNVEMNVDDFLKYLRINYACKLLKTTNYTILNIAIMVGYNNVKTFNNHFYCLKKMRPTDFRRDVEIQV